MREQKTKEYLTAVYLLSASGPVRGAYVARELKLSRPTVSVSLQMLAEAGYLSMDDEHLIHLTEVVKAYSSDTIQREIHLRIALHTAQDVIANAFVRNRMQRFLHRDRHCTWQRPHNHFKRGQKPPCLPKDRLS